MPGDVTSWFVPVFVPTHSADSRVHCPAVPSLGSTYRQSAAPSCTPACKPCSRQTCGDREFKRAITTPIPLSPPHQQHTALIAHIYETFFQPPSGVLVKNEANTANCILITSNSSDMLCPHIILKNLYSGQPKVSNFFFSNPFWVQLLGQSDLPSVLSM